MVAALPSPAVLADRIARAVERRAEGRAVIGDELYRLVRAVAVRVLAEAQDLR